MSAYGFDAEEHEIRSILTPVIGWPRVDRWLAARDKRVAVQAWAEGAASRQCHCAAWNEDECACGNYPSSPNPYRAQNVTPDGEPT